MQRIQLKLKKVDLKKRKHLLYEFNIGYHTLLYWNGIHMTTTHLKSFYLINSYWNFLQSSE